MQQAAAPSERPQGTVLSHPRQGALTRDHVTCPTRKAREIRRYAGGRVTERDPADRGAHRPDPRTGSPHGGRPRRGAPTDRRRSAHQTSVNVTDKDGATFKRWRTLAGCRRSPKAPEAARYREYPPPSPGETIINRCKGPEGGKFFF